MHANIRIAFSALMLLIRSRGESILPVKKFIDEMLALLSVWSKMQI